MKFPVVPPDSRFKRSSNAPPGLYFYEGLGMVMYRRISDEALHNPYGPAVLHFNGKIDWWLDGDIMFFETWLERTDASDSLKAEMVLLYG